MIQKVKKRGFTLVELLMVIAIIGILSLMALAVLANAGNDAKKSATRTIIMRINDLIMDDWEQYATRPLPFKLEHPVANTQTIMRYPLNAARIRVYTLRELMRLELPDRYTDITDGPVNFDVPVFDQGGAQSMVTLNVGVNGLNQYYLSRITAGATEEFQGAECLYLILSAKQDEFGNGTDSFKDSIGDVDNDGMFEILDPWGTPIQWLRWAPGLSETGSPSTTLNISPVQSPDFSIHPDPFDPLKSDLRLSDGFETNDTFRLLPFIYSAGPDRQYDVWRRDENDATAFDMSNRLVQYSGTSPEPDNPPKFQYLIPNDPFWGWLPKPPDAPDNADVIPSVGFRFDVDGDRVENYYDNIDNHFSQNADE